MFWFVAIAVLTLAGLLLAWPLLARGSNWRAAGLAILVLLPLGGAILYRDVGTPSAMNTEMQNLGSNDFNALVDELKGRLSERPEDLEGWLLLGRSLKSLQRYDEALGALRTARDIAPENPLVKVELAEAMLFASGNPRVSDEARALLESAVEAEPGLQKGLWLLGLDAAQRGDDAGAVDYWQRLLGEVEPGTAVAQSVREQIDLARGRLGHPTGTQDADAGEWAGIDIQVDLSPDAANALPDPLPDSAVLFVIVRTAGTAGGPPLGVARLEQPDFPLQLTIDDANAMLPQRRLSEQPGLNLLARLSLSGDTSATPGDWESEAIETTVDADEALTLTLSSAVD